MPVDQADLLAGVRDAFQHLEAAISTARSSRCRAFVGDELYQQVAAIVDDLSARGHRRVHGSFEIHEIDLIDVESTSSVRVRVHATSSIARLDQQHRVVDGSTELRSWTQDLTVECRGLPGEARWIISELGAMSVEGLVIGPVGEPMDPARQDELELRHRNAERDFDEHREAMLTAANFLTTASS